MATSSPISYTFLPRRIATLTSSSVSYAFLPRRIAKSSLVSCTFLPQRKVTSTSSSIFVRLAVYSGRLATVLGTRGPATGHLDILVNIRHPVVVMDGRRRWWWHHVIRCIHQPVVRRLATSPSLSIPTTPPSTPQKKNVHPRRLTWAAHTSITLFRGLYG